MTPRLIESRLEIMAEWMVSPCHFLRERVTHKGQPVGILKFARTSDFWEEGLCKENHMCCAPRSDLSPQHQLISSSRFHRTKMGAIPGQILPPPES